MGSKKFVMRKLPLVVIFNQCYLKIMQKFFFLFFFFFSDSGPERSIISIETVLFCHETPSLEYQGDKVLQTQIPPLHQYYLFLHQIVRRT